MQTYAANDVSSDDTGVHLSGRSIQWHDVRRIVLARRGASIKSRLVTLAIAVPMLGAAVALNTITPDDVSWLVIVPAFAILWSVVGLVWVDERHVLAFVTRSSPAVLVESDDGTRLRSLADQLRARLKAHAPPTAELAPKRLVFLDVVRCLAVVMMVFAHFSDQLVGPEFRADAFGRFYAACRGFTAPVFFTVSGFSFATVVVPQLALGRWAMDLPRRLRRGLLLLMWSYLLTLPWWADGFPFEAASDVWLPFWTAGVLATLGLTLMLVSAVAWALGTPKRLLVVMPVLATIALVLGGSGNLATYAEQWNVAVRGYFDSRGVAGGFPLVPWAGFVMVGVTLGTFSAVSALSPSRLSLVLGGLAATTALACVLTKGEYHTMFLRFSVVFALVGGTAFALRHVTRPSWVLRLMSRYALTFYVSHMLLLWGAPNFTGLVHRLEPRLDWLDCALLTVLCLALTGFAIVLFERTLAQLRSGFTAAAKSSRPSRG